MLGYVVRHMTLEQTPNYTEAGSSKSQEIPRARVPGIICIDGAAPRLRPINVVTLLHAEGIETDTYKSLGIVLGSRAYLNQKTGISTLDINGFYAKDAHFVLSKENGLVRYNPVIGVATDISDRRFKSTLLHELGHFIADVKGEEPAGTRFDYQDAHKIQTVKRLGGVGLGVGIGVVAIDVAYMIAQQEPGSVPGIILSGGMATVMASVEAVTHPSWPLHALNPNERRANRFARRHRRTPIAAPIN